MCVEAKVSLGGLHCSFQHVSGSWGIRLRSRGWLISTFPHWTMSHINCFSTEGKISIFSLSVYAHASDIRVVNWMQGLAQVRQVPSYWATSPAFNALVHFIQNVKNKKWVLKSMAPLNNKNKEHNKTKPITSFREAKAKKYHKSERTCSCKTCRPIFQAQKYL